jgi:ATP-dependent RNA helicase HelY
LLAREFVGVRAMNEPEPTPAERYVQAKRRAKTPHLQQFSGLYPFALDTYQMRACAEVEQGNSVLVAAPTGSGKTVVGEFAIHLALATGQKCFYTTPVKALSNQKYADLIERYGEQHVGLLTGDHAVNGEAPVVVMTTEVLRNMLYAGSTTLSKLGWVVLDEVHYLADRSRGAVWEEVIIQLPESVGLVCLSATVSNAEEFGEWLGTVRGETCTIVEEKRPVPLFQHVLVGRNLHNLFSRNDAAAAAGFVEEGAQVNEHLLRVSRDDFMATRLRDRRTAKRDRKPERGRNIGNGRRVWVPSRAEVLMRLERDQLLPAIFFIFSRVGCDAAVAQVLAAGVHLTSPEEESQIMVLVESACAGLPAEDRQVLGYYQFRESLSRGVASHHAGLLPIFKQCVEQLFQCGLLKVVFATETLALGINMPARTVVIEKMTKWNGEVHADITTGEYTQLTGRAGRRGLDVEGHAVVLWQPGLDPRELAGLASRRTYPLNSSFRPSYNMAVNLIHQFGATRSRHLLELSFAQFQADRAAVGLVRQMRKAEEALHGYAEAAACDRGDFMSYAALRNEISLEEKQDRKAQRVTDRADSLKALRLLKPGDVIRVPVGKFAGLAVMVDVDIHSDEPRPLVVTVDRQARRLSMMDFPTPVSSLARIKVPKGFNPRNPGMRKTLAQSVRVAGRELGPGQNQRQKKRGVSDRVVELRDALRAHPCHECPDREAHARWAERWYKLNRDTETLRRRVEKRTNSVTRTFDLVCQALTRLDYLDNSGVTQRGAPLMRLYNELDLVVAEGLRRGVFDSLTPQDLAGTAAALVFESRRPDAYVPPLPTHGVAHAVRALQGICRELMELEGELRLQFVRPLDIGFCAPAQRWAQGAELDEVLEINDLAAGDFVRNVKQLIDLLGQMAHATTSKELRTTAQRAVDQLRRGVVAYSALLD